MNTSHPATNRSGFIGHLAACAAGAGLDNLFRVVIGATLVITVQASSTTPEAGKAAAEAMAGWVMILFTLPFILLAPTAGALGDRLPKHLLIRGARIADVGAIALAILGLWLHSTWLMLSAISAFAVTSSIFAPVKLAVMPELVSSTRLSVANGRLAAVTVLAILLGTAAAALHDPTSLAPLGLGDIHPEIILGIVAGFIALGGIWGAWLIPPLTAHAPNTKLAWPWEVSGYLRAVHAPGIGVPAWCLAAFWAIGAVAMVGVTAIAGTVFNLKESAVSSLCLILAVGLIFGSVLAPRVMHRAYPAGLPILGAMLTGLGLLGAGWSITQLGPITGDEGQRIHLALTTLGPWMLLCGFGGGLWEVPLTVMLQERSAPERRNLVMAGVTVLSNAATIALVLLMKALISDDMAALVGHPLHYHHAWLMLGGITSIGCAVCLIVYRLQVVGGAIAVLARLVWGIRGHGIEHLPAKGGCLLICNHLSYADGLALAAVLPRQPRFLVHRAYCELPVIGFLLRAAGVIPVAADDRRKALLASIEAAVNAAKNGELVAIFPEGKLTRSGSTDCFRSGLERIAQQANVPVVPAYLHGFWGSMWSRSLRRRWWTGNVRVRLGAPLPTEVTAAEARQAVMKLAFEHADNETVEESTTLGRATLCHVKRHPFATCVIDSQGSLPMWKTAAIARALIPLLGLADDEKRVGVVLPPGRAGTLINLALALDGRTAVNLNHTAGDKQLARMADMAGLRTVISATPYLKRIGNPTLPGRQVLAEQLLSQLSTLAVLGHALRHALLPNAWNDRAQPNDVAAIIFSSGSTGDPKGVQLTHRQIFANCLGTQRTLDLVPFEDVLLSPLPLFHSFGLVPGMWLGLARGITVAAHPDPRDGEAIGKLCATAKATFIISTPSFVRGWMRRVPAEQLTSLRFAVVGAERCPTDLRSAFAEKYHADLLEGYGCTELAPVVAINLPNVARDGERETRTRDGSVGRAVRGVQVLAIDPETRHVLKPGQEGLLVVRSPARMLGYLDRQDLTDQAFMLDGYNTGDIGKVDADGFIFITGRLARFAKIAGEMVPLDNIEAALQDALRLAHPDSVAELAVATVSDETKGERLIVLHTGIEAAPAALLPALDQFPALWKPKLTDFRLIAEIPKLGTGKRDLAALKKLAASALT